MRAKTSRTRAARAAAALGWGVLTAAALAATPARAALGEPEASVGSDRRALSARTTATARDAGPYRVHEFTARGATIREFVNADGVVFAVAWSGYAPPQLAPLLGTYFPEYRAAAREAPRTPGRRQVRRVEGAHVVVDRWGHMRDWHGRAWLPDLLPAGVDLDVIQ